MIGLAAAGEHTIVIRRTDPVAVSVLTTRDAGPDRIAIAQSSPTAYTFSIRYSGGGPAGAVRVRDTVPAEFRVVGVESTAGSATATKAGQSPNQTATKIVWDLPNGAATVYDVDQAVVAGPSAPLEVEAVAGTKPCE